MTPLPLILESIEPDLDSCDPEPELDAARIVYRGRPYVLLVLPGDSVIGKVLDAMAKAREELAKMGRGES